MEEWQAAVAVDRESIGFHRRSLSGDSLWRLDGIPEVSLGGDIGGAGVCASGDRLLHRGDEEAGASRWTTAGRSGRDAVRNLDPDRSCQGSWVR